MRRWFQSTRPHGARRNIIIRGKDDKVSIHAPAWGATLRKTKMTAILCVSIHAPAWGATTMLICGMRLLTCFNPRARMGRDVDGKAQNYTARKVSIHAPAWGATEQWPEKSAESRVSIHAPAWGATEKLGKHLGMFKVSIHAPAWGATPRYLINTGNGFVFQSTRPHGARRKEPPAGRTERPGFNPRARMGRDVVARKPFIPL